MSINDRNKKKNVNEGDKKRIKWKIYVNEKIIINFIIIKFKSQ